MPASRLLIVSNRLPVSASVEAGGVALTAASGGLATGLGPWHARSGGLWIGWPGDVSRMSAAHRAELDRRLAERAIVPVHLSRDQVERYYHGFANRVLWPLFHYLVDRMPVAAMGWDAYRQVNAVFADAVARQYRPGDTIWVHDYQLLLVPALLRERLPGARIGFFLHIPFPSSEVFRVLPWRREVLAGLLGADLIGFHTFSYLRHFLSSVRLLEGVEVDIDRVRIGDRRVTLGAFPMGVDAAAFAARAADPKVEAEAARIRREAAGRRIVLGVDRLDYTKGIPRRLQAVERLLSHEPALRDSMRYIQVAVPSRGEVDAYQRFKRQVEESVGRINGASGTVRSAPVHYIHQSVSANELVALYRAADVMLVTPLRDGMNLVAKEFVASRVDGDGVLLLSEFAGAAAELDGAVLANPYDADAVAAQLRQALAMPEGERRARMARLRRRVSDHDVHAWAALFLDALQQAGRPARRAVADAHGVALAAALAGARQQESRRLLLDYDGTLVPLVRSPELAAPDPEVLALLAALAASPGTQVEIVSGRPHETLEAWFRETPVSIWAEHGLWHRRRPGERWRPVTTPASGWIRRIRPILQQFTDATPGARLEIKTASIAWHYREAQPEFGLRQAHDLRTLLGETLGNQPIEVLEGDKVIEVRLRGVSKAAVAARLREGGARGELVIAIGDDRTDEDLFRALPDTSITVAVGRRPSRARFRVADYRAVRELLRSLIVNGGATVPPPHAASGA